MLRANWEPGLLPRSPLTPTGLQAPQAEVSAARAGALRKL